MGDEGSIKRSKLTMDILYKTVGWVRIKAPRTLIEGCLLCQKNLTPDDCVKSYSFDRFVRCRTQSFVLDNAYDNKHLRKMALGLKKSDKLEGRGFEHRTTWSTWKPIKAMALNPYFAHPLPLP